jgi:hypothetical protein
MNCDMRRRDSKKTSRAGSLASRRNRYGTRRICDAIV